MAHAVRFEDVTKRYPRGRTEGEEPRYRSLRHDLASTGQRLSARLRGRAIEETGTLALRGISFQVEEGDSFALIGPNGAGKSTALKLISRISYPTTGRVRIRGSVAALIEVGAGVHPELTGRENIWLYGQILGMTRADVGRRFDEIVEFSELPHAIDTPVKFYSSGMQLRLGFSIAAHLEPDVFLVDEALAVGDAGFQAKCVERMQELVGEGHTLVFVSHNLAAVESMCQRGILLDRGTIVAEGPVREVLADYLASLEQRSSLRSIPAGAGSGPLRLVQASCHALDGSERYAFEQGEGLEIRLRFESDQPLVRPHVNIGITDRRAGQLVTCSMLTDGRAPASTGTSWQSRCTITSLPLMPRVYQIFCDVYTEHGHGTYMDWTQVGHFRVVAPEFEGPLGLTNAALAGPVAVEYRWDVSDVTDTGERVES